MADTAERDAALRALLVDRVRTSPAGRPTGTGRDPAPLRARIVTGAVLVAVVATSVVVIEVAHPSVRAQTGLGGPARVAPAPAASRSPAPTTSTTPTTRPPLVAPAGWHEITRPQLHAFVLRTQGDATNAAVWEQQAWLDIGCMAGKGWVYDPIALFSDPRDPPAGLSAAQGRAYETAMYGPPDDGPYDWRTAGCHGRTVHETGQDDAH